jgi:hypothetical protein
MESAQLLDDLREIPLEDIHGRYDLESVMERMQGIDASLFTIEVAAGAESSLGDLFDWRNVNDDVKEAYRMSSPTVAEEHSLFERYSMMREKGPESAQRFTRNVRSKLGEIRAERKLERVIRLTPTKLPPTKIRASGTSGAFRIRRELIQYVCK